MKVQSKLIILLVLMSILTSCTKENVGEYCIDLSIQYSTKYIWNDYSIELDINDNQIYLSSEKSTKKTGLIEEAEKIGEQIQCVFLSGNNLYYLSLNYKENGFSIYQLNLETLKKKTVYTTIGPEPFDYWGVINPYKGDDYNIISNFTVLYVINNSVIVINAEGEMLNIDLKSKKSVEVTSDIADGRKSWFYDGKLYYINYAYQLCAYDIMQKERQIFQDIHAFNFYIENNYLIYEDILGNTDSLLLE